MSGFELMEPTDLYNLLNQGTIYPCLSDSTYLLLLDARKNNEYNESHIITAKKAPRNKEEEYQVPYDAELECKTHVIVYDGHTSTLKEQGDALNCAKVMWDMGSRNPIKILKGGYEAFSALYPFLRTQTIIYMPRELDDIKTYPTEIIPGLLYLGNWQQGNASYMQKDLKVKGHVNCTTQQGTFFKEDGEHLLSVNVSDDLEADIHSKFQTACDFIDGHRSKNQVVLVFSQLGISRSAAVVIAYVMCYNKCSLKDAYAHVKKCCVNIRPNRGFVEQLSKWEEDLLGQKQTDISDPNF